MDRAEGVYGFPRMSIQLPRSHKALHFTGSVKALAPERPANALGQERPKAPPPPPPSRAVPLAPPPSKHASFPVKAAAVITPGRLETMRGPLVSIDEEEIHTQSLDRDEIHAALFPVARRQNASQPAPNLPVPHFRSAAEAKAQHAAPVIVVKPPKGGALPLSVWLVAAMIAGIVSYNFAPQAVESVAHAVKALDQR